jgi:hypothetical protein
MRENVAMKDKMKISYEHNPSFRFRRYMAAGVENTTGGCVDWREQVEYARDYDYTTTPTSVVAGRIQRMNHFISDFVVLPTHMAQGSHSTDTETFFFDTH